MADQTAPIDANTRQGLTAVSSSDGVTIVRLWADPITHRLLVDLAGGSVPSFADNETPTGSFDGTNATFTLAHAPNPTASLELFLNGQFLTQGASFDYQLSGTTITFNSPPSAMFSGLPFKAFYRY